MNWGRGGQSQGLDPEYAGLLCYPQTGDFNPECSELDRDCTGTCCSPEEAADPSQGIRKGFLEEEVTSQLRWEVGRGHEDPRQSGHGVLTHC